MIRNHVQTAQIEENKQMVRLFPRNPEPCAEAFAAAFGSLVREDPKSQSKARKKSTEAVAQGCPLFHRFSRKLQYDLPLSW
jgi:hypothetical protein